MLGAALPEGGSEITIVGPKLEEGRSEADGPIDGLLDGTTLAEGMPLEVGTKLGWRLKEGSRLPVGPSLGARLIDGELETIIDGPKLEEGEIDADGDDEGLLLGRPVGAAVTLLPPAFS